MYFLIHEKQGGTTKYTSSLQVLHWMECFFMSINQVINYNDFEKVDIRLGQIIEVSDFPEARKPAFKLKIDFGSEIGVKKSSAQLVGAYTKDQLIGKLVLGVVNFEPKQIGPFISEVLTLGFASTEGDGFIVATVSENKVKLGDKLR